jgi:hypothetical protein
VVTLTAESGTGGLPQLFLQPMQEMLEIQSSKAVISIARAFSVPYHTLRNRLAGRTSRLQAHKTAQILSNAEELTLVQ